VNTSLKTEGERNVPAKTEATTPLTTNDVIMRHLDGLESQVNGFDRMLRFCNYEVDSNSMVLSNLMAIMTKCFSNNC
jgi:hypothetical protein